MPRNADEHQQTGKKPTNLYKHNYNLQLFKYIWILYSISDLEGGWGGLCIGAILSRRIVGGNRFFNPHGSLLILSTSKCDSE